MGFTDLGHYYRFFNLWSTKEGLMPKENAQKMTHIKSILIVISVFLFISISFVRMFVRGSDIRYWTARVMNVPLSSAVLKEQILCMCACVCNQHNRVWNSPIVFLLSDLNAWIKLKHIGAIKVFRFYTAHNFYL